MRILLDTHCWLWLQSAPERLGAESIEQLQDPRNTILLSVASSWEIAIKYALGKLPLPAPPSEYVPSRMHESGTTSLALEHAHVLHVSHLPRHHRDPFDRVLIAQSRLERLPILTVDPAFDAYDVERWPPSRIESSQHR